MTIVSVLLTMLALICLESIIGIVALIILFSAVAANIIAQHNLGKGN